MSWAELKPIVEQREFLRASDKSYDLFCGLEAQMREIHGTRSLLQMILRGRIERKPGCRHNYGINVEIWPAFRHGCLLGLDLVTIKPLEILALAI